jgi:hypothetical protein
MAHLKEAAAEEEVPQIRGHGRGRGHPPLCGGALGARGRGAGAPPPPPKGPEAEAEHGGAEQDQPERDQPLCDNPPRKVPYYRLRPIHFGH